MSPTVRPTRAALLLAMSLLTFLPFIGLRDIVTSHEARVAQVARQMAASGWPWNARLVEVPQVEVKVGVEGERLSAKSDGSTQLVNPWLVPVINGQIRLQKPPLPYWCSAVLFRIFGFGEGVLRFTPALLGAMSVLIVWNLARLLIGRVGAWYAALVWMTSYFIVDEFRKTMADPYLAFFTLAATWAWLRAQRSGAAWLYLFYVAIALGVLAKGPVIFAFVPVLIAVYRLCYRRPMRGSVATHLLGLAVFVVIALPWFFAILLKVDHALELWRYESVGSFADNTEKSRPAWFYLPQLFLITLPWTPVWIMGLIYPLAHFRRRRMFALVSTVVVLVIFSLSNVKKNAYLLPLMAIETIVVAQGLLWLTVTFRKRGEASSTVRVPLMRATMIAVALCVAVQIFLSGIQTMIDNNRSAKDASRLVDRMLAEAPRRSLLLSLLPEEASIYIKSELRPSKTSDEVLMIADDRRHEADAIAHGVTSTPSGPVQAIEPVQIPNARNDRWKVFKLLIARPSAPTSAPASGPAQGQPDSRAPATSSSG